MRILHTSDWHIGRTFHGNSTAAQLDEVFAAMVEIVRRQPVDVVVISGDVFDSAAPAAHLFEQLSQQLIRLRETGAAVVMSSGNHDSAARLGYQSSFAARDQVYVRTVPESIPDPVLFDAAWGQLAIYAIPYLEPLLIRHIWPQVTLRSQRDAIAQAMSLIHDDLAQRKKVANVRSLVMAHTFAAGVEPSDGVEREIRSGGVDLVPLSTFGDVDYVALGHIHGQATLAPNIRYSGAPLHYSFSEEHKKRGVWIVDIEEHGLGNVEWIDLPVPRPLQTIRGELEDLLHGPEYESASAAWVRAIITDPRRPLDTMRKLQQRFPFCATLEFDPPKRTQDPQSANHVRSMSDAEVVTEFLTQVRGDSPTQEESALVQEVIAQERKRVNPA